MIEKLRTAKVVTPDDSNDLPDGVADGLFINTGSVSIEMESGDVISYGAGELQPGVVHFMRYRKVRATGTSATLVVAYYAGA